MAGPDLDQATSSDYADNSQMAADIDPLRSGDPAPPLNIAPPPPPTERPFLALGIRLVAIGLISVVMLLAKLASAENMALAEIAFWRQFIPVCLLVGWLGARGKLARLRTSRLRLHASRAMTGLVGIFLVTGSAILLPLAEATVFGFTAPLFAVLLAVLMLGEKAGAVRWLAVALGLLGVLVIAGPQGDHLTIWGVGLAIGGAFMVALTSIQVRDLGRTEDPLTTVFWYCLFSSAVLVVPMLLMGIDYSKTGWTMLCGAGVAALFGQLFITASLRFGAVSNVIVMDYSGLAWATLWGWLFFDQMPPLMTWVGAPLIIGSGLIIILRERHLARKRRLIGPPLSPAEI